jgi:hypothetical protein
METFGIIMMVLGALIFFAGFGLLFMIAFVYALITYLEGKEDRKD